MYGECEGCGEVTNTRDTEDGPMCDNCWDHYGYGDEDV